MPAPAYPRIKTLTQLDDHTVEIQTKDNRAAAIFLDLSIYDYDPVTATHPMPDFDYIVPTNQKKITYKNANGEMYYDSTPYSSMNSSQKVVFWQWIDKAIVFGMKNYDKNYGF